MIETTEDRELTINGQKVMGKVVTIDHEEVDDNGNPKISVNIIVPPMEVGAEPGKVT
jgi:hypothetical protein